MTHRHTITAHTGSGKVDVFDCMYESTGLFCVRPSSAPCRSCQNREKERSASYSTRQTWDPERANHVRARRYGPLMAAPSGR